MNDTRKAYWAELPVLIPGRYRHRTSLSSVFTLQVSGSLNRENQKTVLYRITPEDRLVRVWSARFQVRKGTAPGSAHHKALQLFLDAAENHPKISRYNTIHEPASRARQMLHSE